MSCPICLDYLPLEELDLPFNPKIKRNVSVKLPCNHQYCRSCLTTVAKDVSKTRGKEFRCVILKCKKPYDPYGLITKADLQHYLKINEDQSKIRCPKNKCDGNILSLIHI